jgi:amino acid permease
MYTETTKFDYENTEVKKQMGGKIVRKVSIKNGKGYKSVTKYHKGKKVHTVKKPIHKSHIEMISLGTFIPGLFTDCKCRGKTRKNKTA